MINYWPDFHSVSTVFGMDGFVMLLVFRCRSGIIARTAFCKHAVVKHLIYD